MEKIKITRMVNVSFLNLILLFFSFNLIPLSFIFDIGIIFKIASILIFTISMIYFFFNKEYYTVEIEVNLIKNYLDISYGNNLHKRGKLVNFRKYIDLKTGKVLTIDELNER